MRGFAKWMFATVAVLAVVSIVAEPLLAQEQQRRRQRQGQRGGRGFGRGGFGFGGGSTALLGNPQVQTELDFTEEQKTAMEKIVADQRSAFGELRDIEDRAEARAKMREISEKASKDAEALLKENQKKRLAEIQLQQSAQFLGAGVFTGEEVSTKLKLTEAQREKLGELLQARRTAIEELGEDLDRRERGAKMRELLEQEREKAVAVLTEEQQEQWKAMLGKPFELELRGFGRGRGGRGGPEGARGERRRPQQEN